MARQAGPSSGERCSSQEGGGAGCGRSGARLPMREVSWHCMAQRADACRCEAAYAPTPCIIATGSSTRPPLWAARASEKWYRHSAPGTRLCCQPDCVPPRSDSGLQGRGGLECATGQVVQAAANGVVVWWLA